MKYLHLTNAPEKAIVDDEDYEKCLKYKWHRLMFRETHPYQYIVSRDSQRKVIYLHRFLMGDIPKGKVVDHISGDVLDNRRENLRITTILVNQINRHRHHRRNTTGIRGVFFRPIRKGRLVSRPWTASICLNYKLTHLGYFATAEEATAARRAAELKFYGEYCPIPRQRWEWNGVVNIPPLSS